MEALEAAIDTGVGPVTFNAGFVLDMNGEYFRKDKMKTTKPA